MSKESDDDSDGEDADFYQSGDEEAEADAKPAPPAKAAPKFSVVMRKGQTALGDLLDPKSKAHADYQFLTRQFPLQHRTDKLHDTVAEAMRKMEKYEIALQGDDYADKDHKNTNHEALQYARCAAIVMSMRREKLTELCAGNRQYAIKTLAQHPYISDGFRAPRARTPRAHAARPRRAPTPSQPPHYLPPAGDSTWTPASPSVYPL